MCRNTKKSHFIYKSFKQFDHCLYFFAKMDIFGANSDETYFDVF